MTDFPAMTPQQLGAVLRGVRREKRLTQAAVGGMAGLPQGAISLIESNPGPASLARIYRVLSALNVELIVRVRPTTARPTEW